MPSISKRASCGADVGIIPGIKRLGIPSLRMNDGPEGFRVNALPGTSTQWPSGLTVAHSWDPELFGLWGQVLRAACCLLLLPAAAAAAAAAARYADV